MCALIKKLRNFMTAVLRKEAEWKQLNARFEKLTPNGQKLYRDLFATYKALDTEFLKSLGAQHRGYGG
jgi:hypothetical protein